MTQSYWDFLAQYSSFIFLGLSVSIGMLCLILWSEVKKAKQRRKEEEEKRLQEMTGSDDITLEELEKRYGKKG